VGSLRGEFGVLTLRTTWFGTFLLEGSEVKGEQLFPKDAREVARRLEMLQRGDLLPEEKRLAQGVQGLRVTERRQLKLGSLAPPEESPVDLASRASAFGFTAALRRDAFQALARASVARARGRDASLVQAVRALDELQEAENRLNERLREWFGLHFPELATLVPTERYAALVASGKGRDEALADLGLAGAPSSGSPLSEADLASVRAYAKAAVALRDEGDAQAKALSSTAREVAPNLSALLGPLLASRLILGAGSLERLSRLPASTVQLVGAEKALFRHLKEGSRPPKHGVLFQHPAVHGSPYWARGRVARALAGKAAIAARADAAASRRDLGEALRASFEVRLAAIRTQKPPPPRPADRRPGAPGAPHWNRRAVPPSRPGKAGPRGRPR
jgi:nucleolar protein 56